MMAKHALWTVALMWAGITTAVQAQQRDAHELDSIANSVFMANNTGTRVASAPLKMSLKSSDILESPSLVGNEAFYIYNSAGDGGRFVIVSGDRRMPAVLGYSDNGNFDAGNMPDGLKWFLQKCEAEASLMAQHPEWTRTADTQDSVKVYPVVEPLLGNRAWGQDAPFNGQCPTIGGKHALTGCVATALAQIMAYHRYPATYDWDNMLDSYEGGYTQEQADAVAKLMHELGEACEMRYGTSVSATGDFNAEEALLGSMFGYDDNVQIIKKELYTEGVWMGMIVNELCEGRPVFYDGMNEYRGNGHAFVLDGLDADGCFHVNWGYEGRHNGYFRLNSLAYEYTNEYGVPQKKDYSFYSDALIYIHPNDSIMRQDPTNIVSDSIRLTVGENYVFDGRDSTFHRDTPIELSIFDFMNMRSLPFKGERQILLVDDEADTLIAPLGNAKSMKSPLVPGSYYSTALKIKASLPADLPDGRYRIYAGVRQSGYEEWGRVTALIWNKDKVRDHYLLILKDGYYTLGSGEMPDGIEEHIVGPYWITLHPQKGTLQFTSHIPLSEWDIVSANGIVVAQGKGMDEGGSASVHSLSAGIYLLRGMGEDGRVYVIKFKV